jgi:hypothetical protein
MFRRALPTAIAPCEIITSKYLDGVAPLDAPLSILRLTVQPPSPSPVTFA